MFTEEYVTGTNKVTFQKCHYQLLLLLPPPTTLLYQPTTTDRRC